MLTKSPSTWSELQQLLRDKQAEQKAKDICNSLLKAVESSKCNSLSMYDQFLIKLKMEKFYLR